MKNNLTYYRRDVASHSHWKFKTLRKYYGWAGEGKFWALNDMIAAADGCTLNLEDDSQMAAIAIDLDFTIKEFKAFMQHLLRVSKLIVKTKKGITTNVVQECLGEVSYRREYQRVKRKTLEKNLQYGSIENGKNSIENAKSIQENEKSIQENQQIKVKEIKENKTKEKESKENENSPSPPAHTHTYTDKQLQGFKKFTDWIATKTPRVAQMQQPFTVEQYVRIAEKYQYDVDDIKIILANMHNWQPLLTRNTSAYYTLLNWKSRDYKRKK